MRRGSWLLGALLVGLGVVLLLRNLGVVHLSGSLFSWWPALLLAAGLYLVGRARSARHRDTLVPGLVLTIYGAFFLLVPLGVLRGGDIGRYWGVFPAAIGVALLIRDRRSPAQSRGALVPAMILLAVGALGLAGAAFRGAWAWWPVILIALGIALILRVRH